MAEETEVARLVARITADASLLNVEMEKARRKTKQETDGMGSAFDGLKAKLISTGKEMMSFRTLAVAAAGVGGLAMLGKSALDAVSDLKDFSDQAQVSTDTIQEMQYAGLEFGVKSDEMVQSLVYFNKVLGEFIDTGQGPAAEAFTKIGLKAAIASGKVTNTQQAFDYIKQNFSKFYTSSTAASGAAEMFGRMAGTKMAPLLMAGGAALDDYAQQAHDTGYVLEHDLVESGDNAADNINKLVGIIKKNLTRGMIEGFTDEFGDFADLLKSEEFKSSVREFGENMASIAKTVADIAPYLPNILGAWGGVKVASKLTKNPWIIGGAGLAGALAPEAFSDGRSREGMSQDQINRMMGVRSPEEILNGEIVYGTGKLKGQPYVPTAAKPPPSDTDKDKTTKANPDAELIADLKLKIELQQKLNIGKEREAEIEAVLARLSPQATKGQRELAAKLAGEGFDLKQAQEQKKVTDEANKAIDEQVAELLRRSKVLALSEREAYIAEEAAKAEETLAKAVKDGNMSLAERAKKLEAVKDAAGKAFDAKKQNESALAISGAFQTAFESAGDSIANLAVQGKLSLSSLADVSRSVAQEIMATFLKLALINPLENAIFEGANGYSAKPTLNIGLNGSGANTASPGSTTESWFSQLGKWFGGFFAEGGDVDPSKYYMVGEKGPELFIPNRAGRIVSNAQLSSGSSTVNHNNQSVHLHINGVSDVAGFRKSEGQISATMIRALRRGQRNV